MSPPVYLFSAFLLLLAAYVVFRVFIRRDYLQKGRLTLVTSSLETLVFFSLGIFSWFDLPADWPPSYVHPLLRAIGWALVVVGLAGLLFSVAWFGLRRALGQEVSVLKQDGPYRLCRNPQIVMCFLAVVGYALSWPSWHSLGWVLLYAAMAHMMVITEEEHLQDAFGDEYVLYCERVPRYFGFPRRQ